MVEGEEGLYLVLRDRFPFGLVVDVEGRGSHHLVHLNVCKEWAVVVNGVYNFIKLAFFRINGEFQTVQALPDQVLLPQSHDPAMLSLDWISRAHISIKPKTQQQRAEQIAVINYASLPQRQKGVESFAETFRIYWFLLKGNERHKSQCVEWGVYSSDVV